ncbi:MAG: mannose-6-phosphate isomerase [Peptostreptococcaceae bacterium]|jgi:mannose-6-phosphate isomerase|nr:mannose-6-phosphate isomerase [Peptostreptococcaceae bacterium]
MLYPLKFEPLFYEKIWGGDMLTKIHKSCPKDKTIGESWDLACHDHGVSIISNGNYAGKSLNEMIKLFKTDLIGKKINEDKFPLLLKILDAKNILSVQVHPQDSYALKNENDLGKTEAWYILKTYDQPKLILGTKDISKDELKNSIKNNEITNHLNEISVKEGETYFIKSGLIHTMKDVLILEIQQNSDTTYRFYDFDRGRKLHINKALDVIDTDLKSFNSNGLTKVFDNYEHTYICYDKNFSLEKLKIKGNVDFKSNEDRFHIYTIIEGSGVIEGKSFFYDLDTFDTIMIPASLGKYKISGNLKLLKSYVPNLEELEDEILDNIKH